MSDRARSRVVAALVVVATVATVLGVVVGYVRAAAVDSGQFANRATVALRDPNVRGLIAERVTDEIVLRRQSDLVAARPIIESVVSSVVGGRAFTGAFRSGVRDVHRALFDRDEDTVTLAVADVGTIVAAGLEVVRPSLAKRVRASDRVDLLHRDVGSLSATAVRIADAVRLLAALLALVAVASVAGAIALSRDRRRTVVHLGIGLAIGGAALALALAVGRTVAVDRIAGPDARAAAAAVWNAFLRDLRLAAWILAAAGAVIAAAADSLIRPVSIDAPLRRIAGWVVTEPRSRALKVLRGVALVAAGLVVLLARRLVLDLLFAAVGLGLVYAGVTALLALVHRPRPAAAPATEGAAEDAPASAPDPSRRRPLVAALVAGVLVVGAVAAFVGTGGTTTPAPAAGPCDGAVEICGRKLDEVALPATHNSMSAPLPGWFSAEQDRSIAGQLRDGIRGLLIDTHYADRLGNGRLRTAVGDEHTLRAQAARDGVSPDAIDAAFRTRERLGFSGRGKRGMYLCHSFCELGGTRLRSVLRDLHDFLVANPGEVVVVVNQDYVTPKDFVGAVKSAGLASLAYRGPVGRGRWPTLRQMIDANQRVVFLAENHAGAAPWYRLAYTSITQETPYTFSKVAQLTQRQRLAASCRPNRGPGGAPMFLVNHWISTDPVPLPSNAEKVNAYGPLVRRLRECRRIRNHIPNLVAVNFYRRGDLFRAVDAMNGVSRP